MVGCVLGIGVSSLVAGIGRVGVYAMTYMDVARVAIIIQIISVKKFNF
jgi:hypothetical protein